MRNYIASHGVLKYYSPIDFKRDLIFFDKVVLLKDNLEIALPLRKMLLMPDTFLEQNLKTIDFLVEKGLYVNFSNEIGFEKLDQGIKNGGKDTTTQLINGGMLEVFNKQREHEDSLKGKYHDKISINDSLKWFTTTGHLNTRLWATILNILESDTYYSSLSDIAPIGLNPISKKENVLKFLYTKIPIIDSQISWEEFIEYKSDKEVQRKYYALINWVNEIANSNLSIAEIRDKFEYLYCEYEHQLNLHRKKMRMTSFQVIVNSPFDITEKIIKLNFGKILNPFFAISKAKIDLLEAESKITGRELGYIFDLNNNFNK